MTNWSKKLGHLVVLDGRALGETVLPTCADKLTLGGAGAIFTGRFRSGCCCWDEAEFNEDDAVVGGRSVRVREVDDLLVDEVGAVR